MTALTFDTPSAEMQLDRVKAALAQLRSLVAELEPNDRELLTTLLRNPEAPTSIERGPEYRKFGAFAGLLSVGPEFYEPLSDEELRAWGEI